MFFCHWMFFVFIFHQYETRVIYTTRTFNVNSGVRPFQNEKWYPKVQHRIDTNNNSTKVNEILAKYPPGTAILTKKTFNVGDPGKYVSKTQLQFPTERISPNIIYNNSDLSPSRPDSSQNIARVSWWRNRVPVSNHMGTVPMNSAKMTNMSIIQKSPKSAPNPFKPTIYTKRWSTVTNPTETWRSNLGTVQQSPVLTRTSTSNVPNNFSDADFAHMELPEHFWKNLPPGAHVQLKSSSRVVTHQNRPTGGNNRLSSSIVPQLNHQNGAHVQINSSSHPDITPMGIPEDFLANLPPGSRVQISSSSNVVPNKNVPHGLHVQINPGVNMIQTANFPQGSHVQISPGSLGIPQGHVEMLPNSPGYIRKITRIVSTYNDGTVNNEISLNRHLPQPSPSDHSNCGDTLCEQEKYLLLKHHNRVRKSVNPPASNMKRMMWDEKLEKSAQSYAKMCIWTHDETRSQNMPYEYVGQNMHATRGPRNVLRATTRWEKEQDNYNIYTGTCIPGKLCGHYTQMVWATTETVGCAMWKCPFVHNLGWTNAYLVVCNYGPGGNIGGKKPYKFGQACSECSTTSPQCVEGLCV